MTSTTPRRTLTTLDKLKIVLRYLRCPGVPEKGHSCGMPLPELNMIDFDHIQALSRGGDNDLQNIRPLCKACHKVKTHGKGATTLGSDNHEKAKTDRLVNELNGLPKTKKVKRPIASRGFQTNRDGEYKRGFNGNTERR